LKSSRHLTKIGGKGGLNQNPTFWITTFFFCGVI